MWNEVWVSHPITYRPQDPPSILIYLAAYISEEEEEEEDVKRKQAQISHTLPCPHCFMTLGKLKTSVSSSLKWKDSTYCLELLFVIVIFFDTWFHVTKAGICM